MSAQGRWLLPLLFAAIATSTAALADDGAALPLDNATRERCLRVLREGLHGDDFWPSIHAAEGLTIGGCGDEVIAFFGPRLEGEADDQRRCGISRELVRAGDRSKAQVMLAILDGDDDYGHVHAAESLYKVCAIGDGEALRRTFAETDNLRLKLMCAGALGRCGNPAAMAFLREMLRHEDPELFKVAAWILGRIGDASDIRRLEHELPRCEEELTRAYLEHSLAALGDAEGLGGLLENLTSMDPAVRTYAATFAGDARAMAAAPRLIVMLDDPHPDARYRAAQSLLDLANPPRLARGDDVSTLVYPSAREHPRYTEGSILELNDGSLLFAITEFSGSGSDFAQAHIVGRRSADGGRTWSEARELQPNTGGMNCMSVTLRRLRSGRVAMFYLQKNSVSDLDLLVRFSDDDAATFGEAVLITADAGYHVVNNDRITQLSSGRLLAPAASTPDVKSDNHFVSHCYLSDDDGRTWRQGRGHVDADLRGAMEPEVLELRDGRVLMIVRTQLGFIGKSYSADGGDTWTTVESLGLRAPEAPATLRRIPATGDLLLIWNNTFTQGAGHGGSTGASSELPLGKPGAPRSGRSDKPPVAGQRTPLSAAVSADEGQSWRIVGNLESDPDRTYAYTSLAFVRDRAVMSYWESAVGEGRLSCRFRSLPVSWFYTSGEQGAGSEERGDNRLNGGIQR